MPHQFGAGPTLEEWKQELEDRPEVLYVLDQELRVVYCNRAWDEFARANADAHLTRSAMIGQPIIATIAPALQPFYERVYRRVLQQQTPFEVEYECSSPRQYRVFQMRVLPLADRRHLLVVHSLMVERPHEPGQDENAAHYILADGAIHLCSHCRRARRADNAEWDWVPGVLEDPPAPVSHGLCGLCLAYFYPEHWQNLRHRWKLQR